MFVSLHRSQGYDTGAMRRLCQYWGVTPFIVHLVAFELTLGRFTGQDDIVVGIPVSLRPQAMKHAVGMKQQVSQRKRSCQN